MKVEQKILFCVGIILALTMAAGSASAAITVDSFTKLTDNPYTDSVPDWSPDDTKIIYMAYTSNWWTHSRIVEMNSDGTGKDEVIPETAWFARYSPDGTKIAYASYPPDGSLSLKDLNSGSVEILVSGEGIYEGVVPDWSPDGKKIVYSRYKWSDKLGQIWIYDLESKTNTKISTDDTVDERYPAWSPDGKYISYLREGQDIWMMNQEGTKSPITNTPNFEKGRHSWSPDSSMIAFTSNEYGNNDIFIINIDGSGKTRLTTSSSSDAHPAWSHNGDKIAFSSNRNGNHDIWVIELDSHNPTVDLSIQDIRPVQVIFNCDLDENGIVDFVAGKPFAVQVKVSISNAEAVEYIVYELLMDGKSSAKGVTNLIDDSFVIYPDDTFDEGTHVITVKINAYNQINEVDENNNVLSETVNVHNINKLDLVYIPVDKTALGALNLNPASYGPLDLDKYESTVEDSNLFIKATYPIPELVSEKVNVEYYGSDIPFVGTLSDMIDIWLMGELITDTLADRSIGVVPHGYFKYHLLDDASGLYYWPINAGLVEVEFPTTTAHEIGHSYGLRLPIIGPGEEYNTNPNDRNSNGIWVNEKQFMSYKMCFMNSGQIFSSSRLTSASLDRWVCDDDYEDLFVSFLTSYTPTTSLPFTKDNVILCSGVVYKNGTIDLMPTYFVENGFADEVPSGDYSLKMFDMNEDVISEILFDVQFFVTADSSGTIETDFSGFAFVASYPEETTSISIEHEGETLVKFNPHSKLLHDAVDSIPDEGFAKNPNQRRNTLHNKIDAFEKLLDERSYEEAQLKLEGDIKDKVEKWVVDDYQTDNPLQLSKEEVLALISEEEARIELISGQ